MKFVAEIRLINNCRMSPSQVSPRGRLINDSRWQLCCSTNLSWLPPPLWSLIWSIFKKILVLEWFRFLFCFSLPMQDPWMLQTTRVDLFCWICQVESVTFGLLPPSITLSVLTFLLRLGFLELVRFLSPGPDQVGPIIYVSFAKWKIFLRSSVLVLSISVFIRPQWFDLCVCRKHPPIKPHLVNLQEHPNSWKKIDNATLNASDIVLFIYLRPHQP